MSTGNLPAPHSSNPPAGNRAAHSPPERERAEGPARTLPDFTPVPRGHRRHNGWSPEIQRAFIEALADTGSVEAASRAVGRSARCAYYLRRHPQAESFRRAWEAALDLGVQRLEDVAMERALHGVEVPVYHFGTIAGTRRVYNDRLLMFMLRNRAPGRFAAGGARGLSAMDKSRLARLKKQWRKEWEEEREARIPSAQDVREMMERKIEGLRMRVELSMSPETRKLYDAYRASHAADEERGYNARLDDCEDEEVEREYAAAHARRVEDARAKTPDAAAQDAGRQDTGAQDSGAQDSGAQAAKPAAEPAPAPAPAPAPSPTPTLEQSRAAIAGAIRARGGGGSSG